MRFFTSSLLLTLVACGTEWKSIDGDGDGYPADDDCWDNNETSPPNSGGLKGSKIHPGATETWYDGFDQNCDGLSDYDQDGDGHDSVRLLNPDNPTGDDCFDNVDEGFSNPGGLDPDQVSPDASETWYDGTDQNCDGLSDYDQDGDGYDTKYVESPGGAGDDCYDGVGDDFENAAGLPPEAVHPLADDDWYDGTDEDCGGEDDFDQDADGFVCEDAAADDGSCTGDCDDTDDAVPQGGEVWYNGIDEDCDNNDADQDGDGFYPSDYQNAGDPELVGDAVPGDCWDDAAEAQTTLNGFPVIGPEDVYPGASEQFYDGIDADCGEDSDFDQDLDGYATQYYSDAAGTVGTDCYDDASDETVHFFENDGLLAASAVYPGASETWYDGTDANCDGESDWDQDGDGEDIDTYTGGVDCDDADVAINTAATEDCSNRADENCDGSVNAQDALSCVAWYYDGDGDGFGDDLSACYCEASGAYSAPAADDCNDGDNTINPDADETCDTVDVDDNCNGETNEIDVAGCEYFYDDRDEDGFGNPDGETCSCTPDVSGGQVENDDDCDDTDEDAFPGAEETCDGEDDDCDGDVDNGLSLYYPDEDEDYYGDPTGVSNCASTGIVNATLDNTDCDDSDALTNPGAPEICDGLNNTCMSGWTSAEEDGLVTAYLDDGSVSYLSWSTTAGSAESEIFSRTTYDGSTVYVCAGHYRGRIYSAENYTTMTFYAPYGATNTILDADDLDTPVVVQNSFLTLDGFTLTGGVGVSDPDDPNRQGGGAYVVAGSSYMGDDPNVDDSGQDYGANLELRNSIITGNVAARGGGISVGRSSSPYYYGYVYLVNTRIYANTATDAGGGVWVNKGTVVCESGADGGGIYDNVAVDGGGVYLKDATSTLTSDGCDWGTGVDDNDPDDVASASISEASYGDDEDFDCTSVGCTP